MKYIVILGDGMSDLPCDKLGGKTPLELADKPAMDKLARGGICGMAATIPGTLSPPGSDIANMAVMGYDPEKYYTGRSPIEAVSMGVPLSSTDVTLRCNLVTLSDDPVYDDKIMLDYSADEISSSEAAVLVSRLNHCFNREGMSFYPGISYRHVLKWDNGRTGFGFTPPHDILTRRIGDHLTGGEGAMFTDMMRASSMFLHGHPVNKSRAVRGLKQANSIWLWGEGTKPRLPSFKEKYGLSGAVISAVDLLKGLGKCAGMLSIDVAGATGTIHTNYGGKARAAIDYLLGGGDFCYIHVEAPDECGHRQEHDNKIRAIELIDAKIVAPVLAAMESAGEDYRVLLLPDHPTPLELRTHTYDPVPFVLYDSRRPNTGTTGGAGAAAYTERAAEQTGLYIPNGYTLMDQLIDNK